MHDACGHAVHVGGTVGGQTQIDAQPTPILDDAVDDKEQAADFDVVKFEPKIGDAEMMDSAQANSDEENEDERNILRSYEKDKGGHCKSRYPRPKGCRYFRQSSISSSDI